MLNETEKTRVSELRNRRDTTTPEEETELTELEEREGEEENVAQE